MPFTFSHPAAIFPLRVLPNRYYSLTGLIAGSIVPDFEYFLRMSVRSIYSHTLGGLFYYDLPIGIAICFIFHDLVRNTFIDHLPTPLQQRFYELKSFKWDITFKQRWYIIIISILIGAASHVLWDDFTHPSGFFVTKYYFLSDKVQLFTFSLPVYKILQNLSSLIGGIIVLNFIWKLPGSETNVNSKTGFYWSFVSTIMIAVICLRFWNGFTVTEYGNFIVSLISAFFIGIVFLGIAYQYKKKVS